MKSFVASASTNSVAPVAALTAAAAVDFVSSPATTPFHVACTSEEKNGRQLNSIVLTIETSKIDAAPAPVVVEAPAPVAETTQTQTLSDVLGCAHCARDYCHGAAQTHFLNTQAPAVETTNVQCNGTCSHFCVPYTTGSVTSMTTPSVEQKSYLLPHAMQILNRFGMSEQNVPLEPLPATWEEYKNAQFTSTERKNEQAMILEPENLKRLHAAFLETVSPYIHDICDASYCLNDTVFYYWLQGVPMTAEKMKSVDAAAQEARFKTLNSIASVQMSAVVEDETAQKTGAAADEMDDDFDEEDEEFFDDDEELIDITAQLE